MPFTPRSARAIGLQASVCAGLAVLLAGPVRAGLGDTVERLGADAARMRAYRLESRSSLPTGPSGLTTGALGAAYTRHPLVLPDGGMAMAFADAQGRVFAVAWNAPTMPDLGTLLGAYKAHLERAQTRQAPEPDQARVRSPRLLRATEGDWTVFSTGHLRAYRGASYLRSWLPPGFDLQELQP